MPRSAKLSFCRKPNTGRKTRWYWEHLSFLSQVNQVSGCAQMQSRQSGKTIRLTPTLALTCMLHCLHSDSQTYSHTTTFCTTCVNTGREHALSTPPGCGGRGQRRTALCSGRPHSSLSRRGHRHSSKLHVQVSATAYSIEQRQMVGTYACIMPL